MSPDILFSTTDSDGEELRIRHRPRQDGQPLAFGVRKANDYSPREVYLTPADITRLRAALEPFDPAAPTATPPAPYGPEEFAVMALAAYVANRPHLRASA